MTRKKGGDFRQAVNPSTTPIRILLAILLLSLASCSYKPRPASNVNTVPTTQSEPATQNQNASGQVKSPLPPPTGFVNDYANVFDSESKASLEAVLKELKEKSAIEFAVVTVDSTGGQPIFNYSLAVARGWGVGPKDTSKGGGLLLMLAIKDREWRIEVSRNLEKDLPNEVCKELGDQSVSLYRQGKFAQGVTQYVGLIIHRLEKIKGFKLNQSPASSS